MTTTQGQVNSRSVTTFEGFVCGGIAACIAVTVSNPAEVAKTRMQLQGELAREGGQKVYKNALDVLAKTWRNEGIRGLQRGLSPAVRLTLSTIRIPGMTISSNEAGQRAEFPLDIVERFTFRPITDQIPITSVVAAATSGAIGGITAALGNPLFLVKARMQAYSPALPVGTQHFYKNSFHALSTIWNAEKMPQSFVLVWARLRNYQRTTGRKISLSPMASYPETALTRVYNQPTVKLPNGRLQGTLYRNPIDCLWKTFKAEGLFGWYKGSTAHFLRIAPHTFV
ncbi:mitochondrial carrier domain-containing protein [Scleroderma yunnanense]